MVRAERLLVIVLVGAVADVISSRLKSETRKSRVSRGSLIGSSPPGFWRAVALFVRVTPPCPGGSEFHGRDIFAHDPHQTVPVPVAGGRARQIGMVLGCPRLGWSWRVSGVHPSSKTRGSAPSRRSFRVPALEGVPSALPPRPQAPRPRRLCRSARATGVSRTPVRLPPPTPKRSYLGGGRRCRAASVMWGRTWLVSIAVQLSGRRQLLRSYGHSARGHPR